MKYSTHLSSVLSSVNECNQSNFKKMTLQKWLQLQLISLLAEDKVLTNHLVETNQVISEE